MTCNFGTSQDLKILLVSWRRKKGATYARPLLCGGRKYWRDEQVLERWPTQRPEFDSQEKGASRDRPLFIMNRVIAAETKVDLASPRTSVQLPREKWGKTDPPPSVSYNVENPGWVRVLLASPCKSKDCALKIEKAQKILKYMLQYFNKITSCFVL